MSSDNWAAGEGGASPDGFSQPTSLAWSPDGRALAVVDQAAHALSVRPGRPSPPWNGATICARKPFGYTRFMMPISPTGPDRCHVPKTRSQMMVVLLKLHEAVFGSRAWCQRWVSALATT